MLKETVEKIAKDEGFSLEKAAAELIAFLGDGSFRDAQSILQKIISFSSDKKITLSEVELVTGAPKGVLLNAVIEGIEEKKIENALKAIGEAAAQNIDMKVFLRLLLERLRDILLLRFAKDLEKEMQENFSETDFAFFKKVSGNKNSNINSKTLDEILRAYEETSFAAVKELPLELALIRLIGEK
mgnify:CR=1 FL=1